MPLTCSGLKKHSYIPGGYGKACVWHGSSVKYNHGPSFHKTFFPEKGYKDGVRYANAKYLQVIEGVYLEPKATYLIFKMGEK